MQSTAQYVWAQREWIRSVLAARTGGRWDVADELWADLVATFVEKPGSLDHVSQLRPWLYQLAVRKAADWIRRRQRDAQRYSSSESEWLAIDLLASTELPPLELLLSGERSENLRQTLAQLPADDHEVLYLKYLHGWSYSQISEHLNLTAYQVTNRLRMARQRLKLALLRSPLAAEYSAEYQLGNQGITNE